MITLKLDDFLFRGSQPETFDDFEHLKELGIQVVIDLENESGESPWEQGQWQKYAERVVFYSVPLSSFWPPSRFQKARVKAIIDTAVIQQKKCLVHCHHGQDRTGLMIGRRRVETYQWSKTRAWDEMLDNGFHPILLGLTWDFWMNT